MVCTLTLKAYLLGFRATAQREGTSTAVIPLEPPLAGNRSGATTPTGRRVTNRGLVALRLPVTDGHLRQPQFELGALNLLGVALGSKRRRESPV